jgi:hypothetical protein
MRFTALGANALDDGLVRTGKLTEFAMKHASCATS